MARRWNEQNGPLKSRYSFLPVIIVGIILAYVLFYVPTPYVVYLPGTAEDVAPLVETTTPQAPDEGQFMLTTVRMVYANVATYMYALVNPNAEITTKKQVFGDQSEKEYSQRQSFIMQTSQSDALQAAYKHLNIPFHIKSNGVFVLRTMEETPAFEILQPGDQIIQVNGKTIQSSEQLRDTLNEFTAGTDVSIRYERDNETTEAQVQLIEIDSAGEEPASVGLGIYLGEMMVVESEDLQKQVEIKVSGISGPSAGLMFSLEIMNRLLEEDISKGYKIAGTGTITAEGKVGVIGGIDHKIIAAHREGADIFFAPRDYVSGDRKILNYSVAVEQAEKIGTAMKVIPVETLQDALDYLSTLSAQ